MVVALPALSERRRAARLKPRAFVCSFLRLLPVFERKWNMLCRCAVCARGFYSGNEGQQNCLICPVGKFSNTTMVMHLYVSFIDSVTSQQVATIALLEIFKTRRGYQLAKPVSQDQSLLLPDKQPAYSAFRDNLPHKVRVNVRLLSRRELIWLCGALCM